MLEGSVDPFLEDVGSLASENDESLRRIHGDGLMTWRMAFGRNQSDAFSNFSVAIMIDESKSGV